MAYQDGFVVSILRNGHPVRETRGDNGLRTCVMPFGTEYKIRIKNSSADYVKACVYIDDTPVIAADKTFLIEPRSHVHLERFVEDLKEGRRFKFVELGHGDVQDPTNKRNGIIRVELQPCKRIVEPIVRTVFATPMEISDPGRYPDGWGGSAYNSGMPIGEAVQVNYCATPRSFTNHPGEGTAFCSAAGMSAAQAALRSTPKGVAGATVEGSRSDQRFSQCHDKFENWGVPTTIEIQLRGMPEPYDYDEQRFRHEYENEKISLSDRPWSIRPGSVCYKGQRLEGIYSVENDMSSGSVILRLHRDAVLR